MKFCTNCGKPLSPNAAFCGECGSPVYKRPDENVNNNADSSAKSSQSSVESEAYANNNFSEKPEDFTKPAVTETSGQTKNSTTAAGDEKVSPKNRLAAFLLGFFLGAFGAHHFYLGNIGRAVTQLLLSVFGFSIYGWSVAKLVYHNLNYVYDLSGSIFKYSGMIAFAVILLLIAGIWALVDWIMILCGSMKDGRNLPVKNWS